jgi:pilus assembly protein CpaB
MRNARAGTIIGVALFLALAAVLVAAKFMGDQSGSGPQVAVATVAIGQGTHITADKVQLVEWPANARPPGAIDDLKVLEKRIARADIGIGEPVLESKLAAAGALGGLSAVVATGKRAMTVRVNDVVGVAGFALPGNYVDILVNMQGTSSDNGAIQPSISKIVLERILVLAVAQESSRDDSKPRVVDAVTLELAPDQVEKLDLARSIGSLSLVLRNQVDPEALQTAGATRESVLGLPPPAPAPRSVQRDAPRPAPAQPRAPAPRTDGVLVIRGLDAAAQSATPATH